MSASTQSEFNSHGRSGRGPQILVWLFVIFVVPRLICSRPPLQSPLIHFQEITRVISSETTRSSKYNSIALIAGAQLCPPREEGLIMRLRGGKEKNEGKERGKASKKRHIEASGMEREAKQGPKTFYSDGIKFVSRVCYLT
jgi:hypothetical protein